MSRMLKKAVTGEGQSLMKMTGTGEVFLADAAQDIHLIYLEDDKITVNGPNVLAFDAGIDWDIERVQGASGDDGRRPLQHGAARAPAGWRSSPTARRCCSTSPPRRRSPTPQAAITWSSGVHDGDEDRRQAQEPDRQGSGETIQMAFSGQGWVLVQPSEGQVAA